MKKTDSWSIIYRSGDVNHKSTIRCYTRQGSAQVMVDYKERPNTDDSVVVFLSGEIEKSCIVILGNDAIYEEEEEFRLVLGTPKSTSTFGASTGEQKEILIKIKDEEDKPVIKFSKIKHSIQESQELGDIAVVKIPVLRLGDSSKVSVVRIHTKDGSATSGEDYNPVSEDIEFKGGETEHIVEVEVLYDGVRETFTVHLKPDENMVAETQVSDPVAAEFGLNTQMFLLSKKEFWISDGSMGFGEGSDVAFAEGSDIYGRVMVDPVQNLEDSFSCTIEKVFLCTGADGYVPKYSPDNEEYGCLADSPSLLYRFKILDEAQPETQAKVFGNVEFHAKLAIDHPDAFPLVKQPGSDGFSLSSAPLFQVAAGQEWYIHTIYMVRSREAANRGIGKRSLEYHHAFTSTMTLKCSRRANANSPALTQDIETNKNRGTNIHHSSKITQNDLCLGGEPYQRPVLEISGRDFENSIMPVVGGAEGLMLLIGTVVIIIFLLKQKGQLAAGKRKMICHLLQQQCNYDHA